MQLSLGLGNKLYHLGKDLQKINSSIISKSNFLRLEKIKKNIPNLKIKFFRSGERVYDWTVPNEWNVADAWIKDWNGKKIIDYNHNPLHLVAFSTKQNKKILGKNLLKKIYFDKKLKKAIPFVTSYYQKDWGFCVSNELRKKIKKNKYYHIFIDSKFSKGKMPYGEVLIKGRSKKEILLSSYICHPFMANNEISGPSLLTFLAKKLLSKKNYYSYRIIFISETIGSISYICKNEKLIKKNVIAGLNISCVGDERSYSFLQSKNENSFLDRIVKRVMKKNIKKFKIYKWLDRGSDERQFSSPNIEIPMVSVMRSKYGEYPEYHTSLDNFGRVVTKRGLVQSYKLYVKILNEIESDKIYLSAIACEPMLKKRNLHTGLSFGKTTMEKSTNFLNVISYMNGKNTVKDISDYCKLTYKKTLAIIKKLESLKLINLI
jgi:aminopeptidase-like protein